MKKRSDILNTEVSNLEKLNDSIIQVGNRVYTSFYGIFVFDIFITAILNRTININRGFISEIKSNNFICAAPLVRIQLDSLLRLYASLLINYNIDEFAMKILKGASVRDLVDSKGKKMNDRYLVDSMCKIEKFSWVKTIYEASNGFIHLSDKHIFTSSKIKKNNRILQSIIKKNDDFVPLEEKIGAIKYQFEITKAIIDLVESWSQRKASYNDKLNKA